MKHISLTCILFLIPLFAFEVNGQNVLPVTKNPVNEPVLKRELWQFDPASLSYKSRGSNPEIFSIPLFGELTDFLMVENEVLDQEFKNKYPEFLTYDLIAFNGSRLRGSLTVSPAGIMGIILYGKEMISFYPQSFDNSSLYHIDYGIQPDIPRPTLICGHDHSMDADFRGTNRFFPSGERMGFSVGQRRYTYRVAIVTTGEFYRANGNNDVAVRTVVINTVNAISAIFSNEMNIRLQLGANIHLFNNPATDPFVPDEQPGAQDRTTQAANAIQTLFNQSNYDIGHVFHTHADGDGWSNGGVAALASVCNNFSQPGNPIVKARGWSGAYENMSNGWINLATHEFGHQFGANHTFNGTGLSCTDAIASNNAYEIGSGTTIMAYQGICGNGQNLPSSGEADNYFHTKSIEQMFNFVYNGNGGSCGNPVNVTNNLPTVTANPCTAVYNLPKSTPFFLKASGSDADNDRITYCWEQIDEDGQGTPTQGFVGVQAANSSIAPIFRSYPPTESPVRYFPNLSVLAQGTFDPFDIPSNVARKIKMNVTIRDNNAQGGAQSNDQIELNVLNSGPLEVTRPTLGTVFNAGSTELITWNTNGSAALCNNVRIKLSVDGGKNYNIVLAENVPYSTGTVNINLPATLPNIQNALLMVECMDYDCFGFFAVSQSTFRINSSCMTSPSLVCPVTKVMKDQGDPTLNMTDMSKFFGTETSSVNVTVMASSPAARIASWNADRTNCVQASVNFNYVTVRIRPEISGNYTFFCDLDILTFATIYNANFNASNACASFIASNAAFLGNNYSLLSQFSANLTACTEYVLVMATFRPLPNASVITQISGPGKIFRINTTVGNEYTTSYIAIQQATGQVVLVNSNPDFRNLPGGIFNVYSIAHLSNINAQSFVEKNIQEVLQNNCVLLSSNFRVFEIRSVCKIISIQTGQQSACNPINNTYTQEIILTYEQPPATGQIAVNNKLFPITSSPQTIILTDLPADGRPVNLSVFFSDNFGCSLNLNNAFTAPANCCPFVLDLGPDKPLCPGAVVVLDAGPGGESFEWFLNNAPLNQNTRMINATLPGTYRVNATNNTGCTRTDEIVITSEPAPFVFVPKNIVLCDTDNYLLDATLTSSLPVTLLWFKDNVVIPGETNKFITIRESGRYKLQATNTLGCIKADSTDVTFATTPVIDLGPDKNVCQGEDVVLKANVQNASFQWFLNGSLIQGAFADTLKVEQSGTYSVIVSVAGICNTQDEILVRFFESPVIQNLGPPVNRCEGQPYQITANVEGFSSLRWLRNNIEIPSESGNVLTVTQSGTYTIEAVNPGGCRTSRSVEVNFRPVPTVNLPNDVVACIGSEVVLDATTPDVTYRWSLNGNIIPFTDPVLVVTQGGNYAVTVTTAFGCQGSDAVSVTFVPGPNLDLGQDRSICQGEQITLQAVTNASTIRWFRNGVLIQGQTSSSLVVNTAGIYEAVVSGGMPVCEVRKSVQVTVNPLPTVDLGPNRTICAGDSVVLDAGANLNQYVWTFNGAPFGSGRNVTAKQSGTYRVLVRNQFNCEATDDFVLTVTPLPELSLPASFNLCQGQLLTLSPVSNGTSFSWFLNNVLIGTQNQAELMVNQGGSYRVVARNAQGCESAVSTVVTERPSPQVNLGRDTSLCPGTILTLNAGMHETILWSDGSTGQTLSINAGSPAQQQSRTVSVIVTNNFGCTASDNINLVLLPVINATISADKPGVCNGQPVRLTAGGGKYYLWTGPAGTISDPVQSATSVTPTVTSVYTVQISDDCPANTVSRQIEIKVFEPTDVSAGKDTCTIAGRAIRLRATGGIRYEWDNKDLIEGPSNVATPLVKPLEETVFTVTITDTNGCSYIESVKVCIIEDPFSRFKPVSIITPNGDGFNDELYFNGLELFPDNRLIIYNRWGNIVYEAKGYQTRTKNLFDGTRNGDRLPADTYYYILTFEGQTFKNSLTIVWE